MHGRLKVRTTEEQKKAKELEREKKLKAYKIATETIFKIRGCSNKDNDILNLSGDVLSQNPDFHTLWNIRKEIFVRWKKEQIDSPKLSEFFLKELSFIEQCLKLNPKSYGAWGHRCFILDNIIEPNWDREIKLTSLFLEFDDRNFHCWDFRRYLSQAANLSPHSELEFTTQKIDTNFSNFSSWHYRSCLLPIEHPGQKGKGSVEENILNNEFKLVQNAFFTDPNDQTAWFYHRYLLSKSIYKCLIDSIHIDRKRHCIIVSFSRPVCAQTLLNVFVNEVEVNVNWKSENKFDYVAICDLDEEMFVNMELKFKITTNESSSIIMHERKEDKDITKKDDQVYYGKILKEKCYSGETTNHDISETCENKIMNLEPNMIHNSSKINDEKVVNTEIQLKYVEDSGVNMDTQHSSDHHNIKDKKFDFTYKYLTFKDLGYNMEEIYCTLDKQDKISRTTQSTCKLSESSLISLKHQITEIQQLFELEPENKWVMHALLTLMFLVDSLHYYENCITLVKKMKILDPMRTYYYQDYESRLKIHHLIEALSNTSRIINLSELGLTRLCDFHRLTHLRSVNLSDNQISDITECRHLKSVELLILKRNRIKNIKGIAGLQMLNILDLENNEVEFLEDLSLLLTCPQLHTVILLLNPITKQPNLETRIKEKITNITNVEI